MIMVRAVRRREGSRSRWRPRWGGALVLGLLATTTRGQVEEPEARQTAAANWQYVAAPAVDHIAAIAAAAIMRNASVSPDSLEVARRRFQADLGRFEARLRWWSDAPGWRDYLQVQELQSVIRNGNTLRSQWSSVDRIPERWRVAALMSPAAELRRAAESLLTLSSKARVAADPEFVPTRQAKLAHLAELFNDPDRLQNGLPPGEVAEICDWLRQRDVDHGLVDAVERRFVHPNFIVRIPQAGLPAELNRPLTESFPINDVIVGTRVSGCGQLTGTLSSQFQPSVGQGILEVSLQGQTDASTTGCNRGVKVSSTGITQLRGAKRMVIDPGGIHPLPATVRADTQITYDAVNAPDTLYGRRVRGHVYGSRVRAEQETACKAAASARSKLDESVDLTASSFNRELRQRVILPLASRQVWPQTHFIRSDSFGLTLAMLQRTSSHFGAPSPPPTGAATSSPQILMHASFPEQIVTELIRGKTISGEYLRQCLQSSDRVTPTTETTNEWSLSFPNDAPVSVAFQDDTAHITLRLAGFHAQGRDFPGMEISMQYCLRQVGEQLVLQRRGEFQIYPIGFVRGEQRLSGPQLATRDVLRRRLEANVPRELALPGLLGPSHGMPWQLTEFSVTDGWLCLAVVPLGRQSVWQDQAGSASVLSVPRPIE